MKVFIFALLPALALGQLPGGITDTTVASDYEPVQYAVKSINDLLLSTLGGHSLSLVEIVRARTQVVAGEKLYLTLRLTGNYYCDVNVWYRPWLHGDQRLIITDGPTCTKHESKKSVGGISNPRPLPDAGDQEHSSVLEALRFGACHMNDRINSMFASVLGDTSAITYTRQVTAGLTYRFQNVPMVATQCSNHGCSNLDLTACQAHGRTLVCNYTVQYQAWMPVQYTLVDLACH